MNALPWPPPPQGTYNQYPHLLFQGMGRVAERLLGTALRDIGISTVVLFELEVGIAKSNAPSKRREQLEYLIGLTNLLPFDREAAIAAARIRAELECQGQPIGPLDNLIAGTALARGATLVTRNIKEFGRIEGLKTEDWF